MEPPSPTPRDVIPASAPLAALIVLALVILRCAWMGDDAYVTLRTVDNFVHGYGLTWNPGERVQAYTHPLWMFALSLGYVLTREAFVMPMLLGTGISLWAVWIAARRLGGTPTLALLVIVTLGLSRSFVDYSTSGLENPLSHLLLALFFVEYARYDGEKKTFARMMLWAALLGTNRMDLLLVVGPAILLAARRLPVRTALSAGLKGSLPFIAWELFSLVYYGSPIPNTAVSKLAHGLPAGQLWRQGIVYLGRQLEFDPLSLVVMVAAIVVAASVARRERRWAAVGIGIALYGFYVVKIGGGFMAGRFFTGPFFASVCLLAMVRRQAAPDMEPRQFAVGGVFVVGLGMMAHTPTPSLGEMDAPILEGIVDERQFWGRTNHLVGLRRSGDAPYHSMSDSGVAVRESGDTLAVRDAVGMFGYHAGPGVIVVDRYALADAFLARLPVVRMDPWRPGHLQRFSPAGYLETLETGESHLVDENLALLWEKSRLVTAGPLFSAARWRTIWELNTGALDHLVDHEFYKRPYYESLPLRTLAYPKPPGSSWDAPGSVYVHHDHGLRIEIGEVVHNDAIDLAAGTNDAYLVRFLRGDQELGTSAYEALEGRKKGKKRGLHARELKVPVSAVKTGYDTLVIERGGRDRRLTIGHLLLSERSRPKKKRRKSKKDRKANDDQDDPPDPDEPEPDPDED